MHSFDYKAGATPISGPFAQWVTDHAVDDAVHLDAEWSGFPFASFRSVRGMVVEFPDGRDKWGHVRGRVVFHGERQLSAPRPEGYSYTGRVSLDGRKRRAHTSSILVKLPDGALVDVHTLSIYLVATEKVSQ